MKILVDRENTSIRLWISFNRTKNIVIMYVFLWNKTNIHVMDGFVSIIFHTLIKYPDTYLNVFFSTPAYFMSYLDVTVEI